MLITSQREILEIKPYAKYTLIKPLLSFSDLFEKTSFSLLAKASYEQIHLTTEKLKFFRILI